MTPNRMCANILCVNSLFFSNLDLIQLHLNFKIQRSFTFAFFSKEKTREKKHIHKTKFSQEKCSAINMMMMKTDVSAISGVIKSHDKVQLGLGERHD